MTVLAGYLPLLSNPSCRENYSLGGGLISDGKLLQRILEKIFVAVFLTRFLFFFLFAIRRFILIIKLPIDYLSITPGAQDRQNTRTGSYITRMMRLQLGHVAMSS